MNRELKNKCRMLEEHLSSPEFYQELCEKANNEINNVIELLAEIIQRSLNKDLSTNQYYIYPTNTYYQRAISLFGLSFSTINRSINNELEKLDRAVSFQATSADENIMYLYDNPKKAIQTAHTAPSILYSDILKQPRGKEQPIVVGASESSYYESVLKTRLENAAMMDRTTAKKASSTLASFVENEALLVVIPKEILSDYDRSNKILTEKIPRSSLGLIKIPSKYQLVQICAQNKRLKAGTKIDFQNGEIYQRSPVQDEQPLFFHYSRYEKLHIDDTFDYMADNLTGDALYDIDVIYGAKDTNKSREKISSNPDQNVKFIRDSGSILVTYDNKKYKIRNGRHRLVYMKNYFLDQRRYCKTEEQLEQLREKCSVVANVTRTIEDKEALQIMKAIKQLIPEIVFKKDNPLNDEVNLIIFYNNTYYSIQNKNELFDFYQNIKNKQSNEKYVLHQENGKEYLLSDFVITYLINIYEKGIVNQSFSDIVEYIKYNGIYKNGTLYNIDSIDLKKLYTSYEFAINVTNASLITNLYEGLYNKMFK